MCDGSHLSWRDLLIVQNVFIMNLALVVTTLGRIDSLRLLFDSLVGRLGPTDRLVVVAQRNLPGVEALATEFRGKSLPVDVTTSLPGAARGRNAGVALLTEDYDYLLAFPNDTTWFPEGTVEQLHALPEHFRVGALTVVDEYGPKFDLPPTGTTLDRWNVWSVIEMGILVRRSLFDAVTGFDPEIGTGATTPWQAGEATDFLLRLMRDGLTSDFAWQPPSLVVRGVSDAHGLSRRQRRHKLRSYSRGLGRLVTRWHYPLWWRLAFIVGGIAFGIRHRRTYEPSDGWWVFLGRVEGSLGRTLGPGVPQKAVTR